MALALSLTILLASIGVSWYLQWEASLTPDERAYRKLGAIPRPISPTIIYEINATTAVADQITNAMKQAYRHDGVLAVRGLIPSTLLQELQVASNQLIQEQHYSNAQKRFKVRGKQFFTVQHSVIFRTPESLQNQTQEIVPSNNAMDNPFLRLAVQTSLPQVAAALLHPTMTPSAGIDSGNNGHDTKSLRILRDIFLAKDDDPCT